MMCAINLIILTSLVLNKNGEPFPLVAQKITERQMELGHKIPSLSSSDNSFNAGVLIIESLSSER